MRQLDWSSLFILWSNLKEEKITPFIVQETSSYFNFPTLLRSFKVNIFILVSLETQVYKDMRIYNEGMRQFHWSSLFIIDLKKRKNDTIQRSTI